MSLDEKQLYILYGSQTGNSEDIAKSLFEQCKTMGISVCLETLNSVKKVSLKDTAKAVVIVCSTTGNGDAPENAELFWRSIKLRSAPKDLYAGLKFSVLGLGDTNYDKFCHMGKSIDKRFVELGATRFFELTCADEATNLEETVEKWKVDILQKIKELLVNSSEKNDNCAINSSLRDTNKNDSVVEVPSVENLSKADNILPPGLLSLQKICELFDISLNPLGTPPNVSILPKVSTPKVNDLKIITSENCNTDNEAPSPPNTPHDSTIKWSADSPFHAKIVNAKWLTTHLPTDLPEQQGQGQGQEKCPEWGTTKRVIELQVSLDNSGMTYSPGDSIGICAPNPKKLVHALLDRINKSDVHKNQPMQLESTIKWHEEILTIEELFSYRLDLISTLKRGSVLTLANYCDLEHEGNQLRWLTSKGQIGSTLWRQWIEAQRIGLVELLALFPSCRPPVHVVVDCLRPLPPRYYSIACSPLLFPTTATVAFSVVRYTCDISPPPPTSTSETAAATPNIFQVFREGLCTSYLERIVSPWLLKKSITDPTVAVDTPTVKIRIFVKPTVTFRLPGSLQPPLILIGPGTGVAPFVGFLQHRLRLETLRDSGAGSDDVCTGVWRGGFEMNGSEFPKESINTELVKFLRDQSRGDIYLFFGCRNEQDYLYKEELKRRLEGKTLNALEVAMSRIGPEKVYVTHRLRARGEEIAQLILEKGGYIFICGDGNQMAKDVHATLLSILMLFGNKSKESAEEILSEMKIRRRYVLDIWS